jgi:hypothetical protein
MTQTASNPLGPQLTVSAPVPGAAVQDPLAPVQAFAAAAGLAGPLAAGPLAAGPLLAELEPDLGPAVAAIEEEGDVLSEVWRASSHLESMQWELDNAHESLRQAVRKACAGGVPHTELCTAANLTPDELAAVLVPAAGGPAALRL